MGPSRPFRETPRRRKPHVFQSLCNLNLSPHRNRLHFTGIVGEDLDCNIYNYFIITDKMFVNKLQKYQE